MEWQDWSRPSLAVDVAVITVRPTDVCPQLALLVLQRETEAYRGEWDIPGAFVHERERLTDAVRRALVEKAGISDLVPVELGVFDDPGRDPRGWVVSVAYTVAVPYSRLEPTLAGGGTVSLAPVTASSSRIEPAPSREGATNWTLVVGPAAPRVGIQLPDRQAEMPFDHQVMVDRAVSVLRERYEIRPDPAPAPEPDPDGLMTHRPFTLTELREMYEAILGRTIQRDAFSRRFAPQTGERGTTRKLRAAGETRAQTGGRPAQMYDIG